MKSDGKSIYSSIHLHIRCLYEVNGRVNASEFHTFHYCMLRRREWLSYPRWDIPFCITVFLPRVICEANDDRKDVQHCAAVTFEADILFTQSYFKKRKTNLWILLWVVCVSHRAIAHSTRQTAHHFYGMQQRKGIQSDKLHDWISFRNFSFKNLSNNHHSSMGFIYLYLYLENSFSIASDRKCIQILLIYSSMLEFHRNIRGGNGGIVFDHSFWLPQQLISRLCTDW